MFIKLDDDVLNADITATELRVICNLLKFSFDDNCSYIGYSKLADFCKISRQQAINCIKSLSAKKFIQVSQRGSFNRSNEIKLTIDEGLKASRHSGGNDEESKNLTSEGSKNLTPYWSKNLTNESKNLTPYKEERFKYQDLNLKNGTESKNLTTNDAANKEELATADRAAVRSMPDYEPAKGSLGGDFEAKDQEIAGFFNLHYPTFRSWYSLIRTTSGNYRVHPVTDFIARIIPEPEQIKTLPVGVMLANTALPPSADFVKIL